MAGRRGWRAAGLGGSTLAAAIALGAVALLARPDEAAARERAAAAVAAAASGTRAARLPASSAMPVGAERLPPAGYLDYCLRFRGSDKGCAL